MRNFLLTSVFVFATAFAFANTNEEAAQRTCIPTTLSCGTTGLSCGETLSEIIENALEADAILCP